ncbi:RecX family transcriptional regulator [Planococcus sp. APC 4015]|nr:RecX family transcriptional regulator [Planococcus sp. APC 4015]
MGSENGGERDALAPVIPLFGGPPPHQPVIEEAPEPAQGERAAPDWNSTWAGAPSRTRTVTESGDEGDDPSALREAAESSLLRKLRSRSLSIREARTVLTQSDLPADQVDDVIDAFVRLGYLDDAALAEQLMHAAVDRKGQGRQVIAQTLAKRGIPRDVADAAIDELPDDDADRALEFARTKARSLSSVDHDTALRRLMGQLARRGYPGSVAMNAAKLALSEAGSTRSGVRFR